MKRCRGIILLSPAKHKLNPDFSKRILLQDDITTSTYKKLEISLSPKALSLRQSRNAANNAGVFYWLQGLITDASHALHNATTKFGGSDIRESTIYVSLAPTFLLCVHTNMPICVPICVLSYLSYSPYFSSSH